ncbi:MAG: hypothetical protein CL398_11555 [Acidiferrobacteraceae bacterium]|nr:hypothetical protein [Acidiferrobacteraceae bacterium]
MFIRKTHLFERMIPVESREDNSREQNFQFYLCMLLCWCIVHSCLMTATAAADQSTWHTVIERDGVTVWARDVRPGQILPDLRAKAVIRGELFHAIAIIIDNRRSPEWMPNCSEAVEIGSDGHTSSLVYSVTNFPWPVADRDTVLKVDIETITAGQVYEIVMTAQPSRLPPAEGRIRIPYSEIVFALRKIQENSIEIEYRLSVDPGGSLPKWLIRSTIRNTMVNTIRSLESQLFHTQGEYRKNIALLEQLLN